MDKVIVTGVNGFVGFHLVNELLEQGFSVVGVGREQNITENIKLKVSKYYSCDLSDYEQVKQIPLADIKAIINLAGLAAVGPSFDNPELYMRINTAVLDTVCKSAIEKGAKQIRIISISSGAVYSADQAMPLTEESLLAPESSPYAASKIAMEKLSLQYRKEGLDCVVARPFNHIGPGQMPGFILPDLYKKVTDAKNSGSSAIAVGNIQTKRDYTDVRDVARAYVALVSASKLNHGIYNVCTGRSLSGEDILSKLQYVSDSESIEAIVDQDLFRPSDAMDLYGDNTALKQDTGWDVSIEIDQTISDFVEWSSNQ